ncbi:MAG: hypothetical protein OXF50_15210 [Caldilineaceae bacterium]|nr:hypothetical protein [Caldilineaceae bacterium]
MRKPITTVGIGFFATYVGRDAAVRILGPTADYLGVELIEFTIRRVKDLGRIFANTERKLGVQFDDLDKESPEVL